MRVLITGGSGFIGCHLVEGLAREGFAVSNLDIKPPLNGLSLKLWNQVDILDRLAVEHAFKIFRPTHVVHLASRTDLTEKGSLAGYAVNIAGTRNIVRAIDASPCVRRAIIASSMLVCRPGYIPKTDIDYAPTTLYGESKVLTETITRDANLKCEWILVRPTTIWGPWHLGMRDGFFSVLQSGWYVHPAGMAARRSYGYVGNVVHQVSKMLEAPQAMVRKRTFYVGDPAINLREWVNAFSIRLCGKRVIEAPRGLLRLGAWMGDVAKWVGLSTPLTSYRLNNIMTDNDIDMSPTIEVAGESPYSVQDGVEMTARWLQGRCETLGDGARKAA